eukprot:scaffold22599_cov139-Cylindrotheca_fusiformis.AAC.3
MAKGGDSPKKEKVPGAVKRPTKKKPKDKPKRPLSAYNFFFKEEREKIIKVVLAEDPSKVQTDPEADDFLDEAAIGRLKKEGGKVSFEEMGKIIGQRWKNIDPDRLSTYSEMASEDTERYKTEMQAYNGRQEAKMRSEAMKAPVTYAPSAVAGGPPGRGPDGYPADMSRAHPAMYPEQMGGMSAFNPGSGGGYGPYGGMDYGGYGGMGMGYGAMGGYGGYGMGAQGHMGMEDPNFARGGGYGGMGMMGGGFQGSMMGYGGGGPPPEYSAPPQHPMDQQQQQQHPGGPPPPNMYGGGYGGGYPG